MKITNVHFENFRQYKQLDLDLSGPSGDLAILQGRNSAGKSNFLNGVIWAIYGDLDEGSSEENLFITNDVVLDMEMGSYATCVVSIQLKQRDGTIIHITRSQECVKTKERLASPYGASNLTVQVSTSTASGFDVIPDGQGWVERNLPARFRPYFLFDGEKLATFFRDTDSARIKSAIQEVAQIDILDRMQKNLTDRSQDLVQKAGRQSGIDGGVFSDRLENLKISADSAKETTKQIKQALVDASDHEAKLDAKLVNYGALEANIRRKRQLDTLLDDKEANLTELKGELEQRLRVAAPPVFCHSALEAFAEAIQTAKANNTLPPPIDIDYLKSILEKEVCICGTELPIGSNTHSHITQVISKYDQVSEIGSILYEFAPSNQSQLAKLDPVYQLVKDTNGNIGRILREMEGAREEQKTLASQLEGVDDSEMAALAVERNGARALVDRCKSELRTAEAAEDRLAREISEITGEINRLASANEEARKLRNRATFSKEMARAASELYEKLNGEVRQAVETSFQDLFLKMIWNPQDFSHIGIDEQFKVSVRNARGFEELSLMNAGHRLCLAFAFALTLSKTAGLNFPMVVDTPSGRLDEGVQTQLAEVLCDFTLGESGQENHQLILLMTSSEYNKEVANVMSKREPVVREIVKNAGITELAGI